MRNEENCRGDPMWSPVVRAHTQVRPYGNIIVLNRLIRRICEDFRLPDERYPLRYTAKRCNEKKKRAYAEVAVSKPLLFTK